MSFQGRYAQLVEQRIRNAKVVGSTPIMAPSPLLQTSLLIHNHTVL